MTMDNARLGQAVREIRKLRALTQAELATKAGLSGNSVAILERGERNFTLASINALAQALDVPASFITVLGTSQTVADPAAAKLVHTLEQAIVTAMKLRRETSRRPRRRGKKLAAG